MLIPCSLADARERLGIALLGGGYLPAVTIAAGHTARKPRPAKDARFPYWGGERGKEVPSICVEGKWGGWLVVALPIAVVKYSHGGRKGLFYLAQNLRVQSIMRES